MTIGLKFGCSLSLYADTSGQQRVVSGVAGTASKRESWLIQLQRGFLRIHMKTASIFVQGEVWLLNWNSVLNSALFSPSP